MKKLIYILVMCMVALVSCERKVLLEPGHHHGEEVHIRINVDVDVDVDTDVYFDAPYYSELLSKARSVYLVSYPKSGQGIIETHKLDSLAGTIWLMPGLYDLLIYTSDFHDLDGLFYRGMKDPYTAEAYTNQVKVKDRVSSSNQTMAQLKSLGISEPDPLFTHLYQNFEVIEGENVLTSGLDPLSYRYWFEVDVQGLEYITSAQLEIAGMYTTVYLSTGRHRSEEYGLQRIEATLHPDENKIKGEFFSFGPHQDEAVANSMILTFVNGRTIKVHLDDISPEIKKLTKGGEIIIEQKIVINVDDSGAGFKPNVDDWEDIEIEIPI